MTQIKGRTMMKAMLDRTGRLRAAVVACVVAVAATACGTTQDDAAQDDSVAPPRVSIVATTSILGSIVEDLAGDAADVTVLIGPGVDPHSYQASARDAQIMRNADIMVANGPLDDVPLEESLLDLINAVRDEGIRVFDFVAAVDPLPFAGQGHDDDDDHDHDHGHDHDHDHDEQHDDAASHDDHAHGSIDPHFWWDLTRVARGVDELAVAIAAVDPHRSDAFWIERGSATAQRYRDLDQDVREQLSVLTAPQRVIVTNHDSFGYFAQSYDFTIRQTVIPGATTQVESNPRAFAALIDLIVDEKIRVIFADNTNSTRLAEQLATQAGQRLAADVAVVRLYTDALGPDGSGADSFVGMVHTTVGLIVEALR